MARRSALWSRQARNDVESIWDHYLEIAGAGTAEQLVCDIARVVTMLEDRPLAGRSRDDLRLDLRSFATPPHVVFYRVVGQRPEIVRVLDGRRDIDEIFAEDSGA